MRKLTIFLPIFLLSIMIMANFNVSNATYYGEEPYEDGGYIYVEFLQTGTFIVPASVSEAEILVVAAGGAGGDGLTSNQGYHYRGGGGGAGGLVLLDGVNAHEFNATEISNGVSIIVGSGTTTNGGNSYFGSIIAVGGGVGMPNGGGGWPNEGGSGGGGLDDNGPDTYAGAAQLQTSQTGLSGSCGWGTPGHASFQDSKKGGFGGGAVAQGGASNQSGKSIWGATYSTGGTGGTEGTANGASGANNTGDGGAGGKGKYDNNITNQVNTGGLGGSGIVIVRYDIPDNIPIFTSPANGSVVDNLKATVEWDAIAGAVSYDVRYDTDSNMSNGVQLTGLVDTYTLNYLSNDTYWFDVRAKFGPANYSAWNTDFYDPLIFTKNDKPVFSKPDVNETSANVTFEWSDISDFTEYELRVFTDAGLTALYTNSSPTDNEDTLTLVNDDYWAEVRAKDNYYTGAWSDARAFNLLIAAVPFTSTPNCVNLYVGDTLQYDFSSMDVNATYTFKINRIDTSGNFVSTTTTKTVVGDADGNGSFTYVFPADSYYPFEVRYHESNAQIYKHFVAPRPSNLYGWTLTGHRVQWAGNVMSVAIGDVAYNNWTGQLHDPYNSIESLYETDEYVLLHYSILPRDTNISSVIDITNLDTGVTYLTVSSKDLHNYEFNGTYCNRNFIIIPLDGVMPDFVDADFELVDYEAIDFEWYNNIFNKGAYDYIQYVSHADEVVNFWEGGGWENGDLTAISYGESVMLIGDDDTVEWSVTPLPNSLYAGNEVTWTITCNTENIWKAYNQMYFRDKSSDTYYLGGAGTFETYPSAYTPSFTIKYNVEEGIGGAIYRVSPEQLNWYLSAGSLVNYDYIFDKSITITDAVDSTEVVDDWLDIAGLNTANGKLIIAMISLIIVVTAMALLGVPVALVAMIAMAVVIIFTTLGFIPIWVIVLIGLAMVLLLIRSFTGGGGGGGGDE